jgi:hypothetical protein
MPDLTKPFKNAVYKHRSDTSSGGCKNYCKKTRAEDESDMWDEYFGGVSNPLDIVMKIRKLRRMM